MDWILAVILFWYYKDMCVIGTVRALFIIGIKMLHIGLYNFACKMSISDMSIFHHEACQRL